MQLANANTEKLSMSADRHVDRIATPAALRLLETMVAGSANCRA